MKNRNYVMSLYCGDTYLDVYGSIDKDELDIGHVGGVDIEDVFIACLLYTSPSPRDS